MFFFQIFSSIRKIFCWDWSCEFLFGSLKCRSNFFCKYCSKFHPNKERRHTVSVDNLDEIEDMSTDEEDEEEEEQDDDDDKVAEDGEGVNTAADDVNPPISGKHCCLCIILAFN